MVEFEIRVHPEQHLAYFPKEVVKALGNKLRLLPNSKAAIIYSEGTDLKDVLTSIEILKADLQHRIEMAFVEPAALRELIEKLKHDDVKVIGSKDWPSNTRMTLRQVYYYLIAEGLVTPGEQSYDLLRTKLAAFQKT